MLRWRNGGLPEAGRVRTRWFMNRVRNTDLAREFAIVEGESISPKRHSAARALKRSLEPKAEPGLQTITSHLAELTENPASLPVALAQATAGAQARAWFQRPGPGFA